MTQSYCLRWWKFRLLFSPVLMLKATTTWNWTISSATSQLSRLPLMQTHTTVLGRQMLWYSVTSVVSICAVSPSPVEFRRTYSTSLEWQLSCSNLDPAAQQASKIYNTQRLWVDSTMNPQHHLIPQFPLYPNTPLSLHQTHIGSSNDLSDFLPIQIRKHTWLFSFSTQLFSPSSPFSSRLRSETLWTMLLAHWRTQVFSIATFPTCQRTKAQCSLPIMIKEPRLSQSQCHPLNAGLETRNHLNTLKATGWLGKVRYWMLATSSYTNHQNYARTFPYARCRCSGGCRRVTV
jgi:hypothetical protein